MRLHTLIQSQRKKKKKISIESVRERIWEINSEGREKDSEWEGECNTQERNGIKTLRKNHSFHWQEIKGTRFPNPHILTIAKFQYGDLWINSCKNNLYKVFVLFIVWFCLLFMQCIADAVEMRIRICVIYFKRCVWLCVVWIFFSVCTLLRSEWNVDRSTCRASHNGHTIFMLHIYIYILVHCNGPPTNSGSILNGMLANSCWNFNLIDLHDCQVDRSVERYATVCVMEPLCWYW